MTDSVPSTEAPSDEGPPSSGQVEEQPVVCGGYAFRKREGIEGILWCTLGPAGEVVGPWLPFVPQTDRSLLSARNKIAHAMDLIAARVVACPTGAGPATRELAELGSAFRALGFD